jgi:DNA mismatch repair protein MLH3
MFNDALTHIQCERLLAQLSQTAFPFQCAHGRPSLVPLTSMLVPDVKHNKIRQIDWNRLSMQ